MLELWRFKKLGSHKTAQRPKKDPIMKAGKTFASFATMILFKSLYFIKVIKGVANARISSSPAWVGRAAG
jgi:hypothetical protein